MRYLNLITKLIGIAFTTLFLGGGAMIIAGVRHANHGDAFAADTLLVGWVVVAASMPLAVLYEWLEGKLTAARIRERMQQDRVVTFL